MLVFGTANQTFPTGWLQQSFQFQKPFFHDPKKNDMHGCPFGLVQKKGGPCGILAVVQAYIIKVVLDIIRKQKPIFISKWFITICYLIFIFGFQNHLIQEFNKDTVPGMAMGRSKFDAMKVVKYCFHHRRVRL